MKKHIIDFFWYRKYPYLVFRRPDSNKIERIKLLDYRFNWKFLKKRICPGTYKLTEWEYEKCSDNADLTDVKYLRCRRCEEKIGFRGAFLFGREVTSPDLREYLSQNHLLYLTFFPPDIVKVGTISEQRKLDRLYEQDSQIYCFIAKDSGFDIQRVERYISKNFGLKESVSLSHKFKYLDIELNLKNTSRILKEKFTEIRSGLQNTEFANLIYENIECKRLRPRILEKYGKINFSNREWLKDYVELGGKVVGVRGRFIIFKNSGNLFVIDGKKLIGKMIEELDCDVKIDSRKKQIGLI